MKIKQLDSISLLLSSFIILLSMLFYYLYNVDKSVSEFTKNHNSIVTLKLIDKDLDNFLLKTADFSNYDNINNKDETFEKTLKELQNNLNVDSKEEIKKELININEAFQSKRDDIEYFKSLNASLLNSSHFLYDLQANITDDPNVSQELASSINETLFFMLQYSTSSYIDKNIILNRLTDIKKTASKTSNELLYTFYQQSILMLNTLASLKKISKTIQRHQLYNTLQTLHLILEDTYKRNLVIQKGVASLFFLLTILILIALIVIHIRNSKHQKKLQAFTFAMQHSDNSIIITDPQRNITFVNDAFEKITGYTYNDVIGQNPRILKSDQHEKSFYAQMNDKLDKGENWEGQIVNKRKDGSLFYEKASIVPVFLNNTLISYLSIKLDITDYIEKNMKLAQAASIFENTEEAIIIADANGNVMSINTAFYNMYGYSLDEVKGKNLSILRSGQQDTIFYNNMWEQINQKGLWKGKIINRTKDGNIIPVWTTIKRVTNENGDITNYTATQTDLHELEMSQSRADYLAYHDPLTGLYNRANFEEHLAHAIKIAKRNKSLIAVLFIDLDRFKVINDTLGHDIGDEVLIEVAKRLKNSLKESDFISRWGGDEFVVILENLSSPRDAAAISTTIIDALRISIDIRTHHLFTTASIGIAMYPENGKDINTLIKHADSAMYLAKDMGKNNFRYYTTELSQKNQKKLDIDIALHNALDNDEFYMLFQPQYDLKTKRIVAAEALIRWESPSLGFVSPNDFIPIAEDTGAINDIGYFVFEASCKAYAKLLKAGIKLEHIAINVSSIQFKDPNLLETFISISQKYDLDPKNIEIEITERFIMEQTLSNISLLQDFRSHGFKVSIDDFGTGYSSMSYLKQLPVDTIKIDKSFIDDIVQDSSGNVVIEAIIALSRTLGYSIVAEGIETQEQDSFLEKAKCDLGQGYLFSRPISTDEIIKKFAEVDAQ